MFKINEDLSIYATRGDIVFFKVTAEDKGENYKFQPGEVVRMTVYEKKACNCVVLQKDFPVTEESEFVDIFLKEEETRIGGLISKPVDYWYEIELNPRTNPQTIVGYDDDGAKVFKLFPEGNKLDEPAPDIEPEDIPIIDGELDLLSPRPVENRVVSAAIIRIEERSKRTEENAEAGVAANAEAIETHTQDNNNPHNVTAEQLGLGNVINVSTNDQTPTYEEAETLGELTSGEKLSAAFGKLKKAVSDLISHLGNKNNPHNVTAEQVKARPDTWLPSASDIGAAPASHAEDTNNPHGVTAAQVGARPDTWIPTASEVGATPSDHAANKNNPHDVTAAQVGARPDTWLPTPQEINAVSKEGNQTILGECLGVINYESNAGATFTGVSMTDGELHSFSLGTESGSVALRFAINSKEKANLIMQESQTVLTPALAVAGGGTGGTTKEEAQANLGFTSIDVLWRNESLSSAVEAQNILGDFSAYDGIFVYFDPYAGDALRSTSGIIPKAKLGAIAPFVTLTFVTKAGKVLSRSMNLYDDLIKISDGYKGETIDDNACLPLIIYGIKNGADLSIGGDST